MKIYRRDEFLKLPAGTIFAKGKPQYFESLSVKADSLPNDFVYRQLVWFESHGDTGDEFDLGLRFDAMVEIGASFPMEQSYGRDGCFDNDDLFLVYERADLLELRGVLDEALLLQPVS
jgi:hypothetical protein